MLLLAILWEGIKGQAMSGRQELGNGKKGTSLLPSRVDLGTPKWVCRWKGGCDQGIQFAFPQSNSFFSCPSSKVLLLRHDHHLARHVWSHVCLLPFAFLCPWIWLLNPLICPLARLCPCSHLVPPRSAQPHQRISDSCGRRDFSHRLLRASRHHPHGHCPSCATKVCSPVRTSALTTSRARAVSCLGDPGCGPPQTEMPSSRGAGQDEVVGRRQARLANESTELTVRGHVSSGREFSPGKSGRTRFHLW